MAVGAELEAAPARLDRFNLLILDDISYAHNDLAETPVAAVVDQLIHDEAGRHPRNKRGAL